MKFNKLSRLFGPLAKASAGHERIRPAIESYFDAVFYKANYPDIAAGNIDPLDHYIGFGWKEGRDPAPWFSTSSYLSANPDVAKSGMNPLYHFVRFGRAEGRVIVPSLKTKDSQRDVIGTIRKDFDENYYLATYPDIAAGGINPVEHYAIHGWQEGRDPAPWFSTKGYLDIHHDIRHQGINPFYHYVKYGRAERRTIIPARHPIEVPFDPNAVVVSHPALQDLLRYPERKAKVANKSYDPRHLDIHWVIPDFSPGGGGHMTIFRMVRFLELFGHKCTVWINRDHLHPGGNGAYDEIVKHYQPIRGEVRVVSPALFEQAGDAIFATDWQTVWPVTHCTGFKEKFYFVQDYEPMFHARGSESVAAELTYSRDIACICASPWLKKLMQTRHKRWARSFWLSYNPDVYRRKPRAKANKVPRIAVYYRASTPRRLVEFSMLALSELARRNVKFHIDLYGWPASPTALPFPATNHGVLNEEGLASLYNATDIGICFSGTNYSLVPQEMMACGLPVVEFDNESTRAIFPKNVVAFAGPEPAAIADTLERLIKSPEARARQAEAALKWVGQFSWEQSARDVESAVKEKLGHNGWKAIEPRPSKPNGKGKAPAIVTEPVKASVIIPTFNAGEAFKEVIARVRSQRLPWKHEIVVIDSSSTDGTPDFCKAQKDIVFDQIPQKEFNHGRTRNRAISLCRGEYVAVLTQDALPTDDFWLYNFIILMDHYPNAAGAFGKHLAWPNASPFVRRELEGHFAGFDKHPLAVSMNTNRALWDKGDVGWRQFLFFYSDNNSCMRRSVWEKLPYPEAVYGEDQLWARAIVEAGYDKLYSPKSVVYHSHDYNYEETVERAVIEARYFRDCFNVRVLNEDPEKAAAALSRFDVAWAHGKGIGEDQIQLRQKLNHARMIGYARGLSDKT